MLETFNTLHFTKFASPGFQLCKVVFPTHLLQITDLDTAAYFRKKLEIKQSSAQPHLEAKLLKDIVNA